jgi:hypothetical protein
MKELIFWAVTPLVVILWRKIILWSWKGPRSLKIPISSSNGEKFGALKIIAFLVQFHFQRLHFRVLLCELQSLHLTYITKSISYPTPNLKMEAERSFEIPVSTYSTTPCYHPKDNNFSTRLENPLLRMKIPAYSFEDALVRDQNNMCFSE